MNGKHRPPYFVNRDEVGKGMGGHNTGINSASLSWPFSVFLFSSLQVDILDVQGFQ